jgi:phosphate transport system substrate-binding protein
MKPAFPSWPVLLTATLVLVGCGNSRDDTLTLVLTGSSTVAPLAVEIGRRFEERHPGVRIDIQTGGSSRGITDVDLGRADIGMASRALQGDEAHLHVVCVAVDGVCLIVHEDNRITELSDDAVRSIYRREIRNWSAVGGPDAPITVVQKAEGRATLEVFMAHYGLRVDEVKPDVVIGENLQGIKTVAGNPHAIGYVSIGSADQERAAGTRIKLLAVQGIPPDAARVADGSFPITRPLNFLTRGPPEGLAARFLAFATSASVHDLIEAQGFVPFSN